MDRDKALDMALGQIEKQFGKGSVMRMGEKGSMAIEAIPTGALALDLALGVGGLPRGRVTEIYGPESSVSRRSPPTWWPKRSATVVSAPTSTPNTQWTLSMLGPLVSIPTACSSPSPTRASKPSKSPTCWFVLAHSMSSLSLIHI